MTLLSWPALGGLATSVERAAIPANHVTRLIAAGRIDLSEPLRWRGRLREDPLLLPWGRRYEIALEEVVIAGATTPVSGGLRANLYNRPGDAGGDEDASQRFRAGDRVEALVRARPPAEFSRSWSIRSPRLSRAPEDRSHRLAPQRRPRQPPQTMIQL